MRLSQQQQMYLFSTGGEDPRIYFVVVFLLHLEVLQMVVELSGLLLLLSQPVLNFLDELHILFPALPALEPLVHDLLVLLELNRHVVLKSLELLELVLKSLCFSVVLLHNFQLFRLDSLFCLALHHFQLLCASCQLLFMLFLQPFRLLNLVLKSFLHHLIPHFCIIAALNDVPLFYLQLSDLLEVGLFLLGCRLFSDFGFLDFRLFLALNCQHLGLVTLLCFLDFFLVLDRQIVKLQLMRHLDGAYLLLVIFPECVDGLSIVFFPSFNGLVQLLNLNTMLFLQTIDFLQSKSVVMLLSFFLELATELFMSLLGLCKLYSPLFILFVILVFESTNLIPQFLIYLFVLQLTQQLVLSKIFLQPLNLKLFISQFCFSLRQELSILWIRSFCMYWSILICFNRQMLRNADTVASQEGGQLMNDVRCFGGVFESGCLSRRRRPVFLLGTVIAKHVVVIINNFSCKMSTNYDRRTIDKENSYEHSYYPSSKPSISNDQLRRKFDHNLALMEKNHSNILHEEHEHHKANEDYSNIKRDNARKRGFDMKVNNIESINQKITGLLSMVRKDKQRQIVEAQRERPEACKTPSHGLIDRIKRMNVDNGSRFTPTLDKQVSSFVDISAKDRKRGHYNIQEPLQTNKNDIQHLQKKQKLRSRPLQADNTMDHMLSFDRYGKDRQLVNASSWLNAPRQDSPLREIKNYAYRQEKAVHNQIAEQKKNFDNMLEERRKQRILNRQNNRDKSETRLATKSAIKPKYAYNQLEESINFNKRDSPIIKVSQENFRQKYDYDEPFARIKTPSPKKQSPRARDRDRFAEVTYLDKTEQQHTKINTTARLIDEQLLRIKSKINESETKQKRLQTYKPKNSAQPSKAKEHIIRVAESISAQVQFDTNLKPAREAFEKIEGEKKWAELQQKLCLKGIRMNRDTLREMMQIGPDQHNPFGAAKKAVDIQELVELVAAAQKNWENCALKCASARALKNENFQVTDLDLHNKGYLGIEDLVCFVNLYSNTFFRNRDMALVMRRLQVMEGAKGASGISYSTFVDAFST